MRNILLPLFLILFLSSAFGEQTGLSGLGLADVSGYIHEVKVLNTESPVEPDNTANCTPDSNFQSIKDKSGRNYHLHREWRALMDDARSLETKSQQWANLMYSHMQILRHISKTAGEARIQADLTRNFSILNQAEANLSTEEFALRSRELDIRKKVLSEILKSNSESEITALMIQYGQFVTNDAACFMHRKFGVYLLAKLIGWQYIKESLGHEYDRQKGVGITGRTDMDILKNELKIKQEDYRRLHDQAFDVSLRHMKSLFSQRLTNAKSEHELDSLMTDVFGPRESALGFLARRDREIGQGLKLRREELSLARTQLVKAEQDALDAAAQARSRRAMEERIATDAENRRRITYATKNNSSPEVFDIEYAITSASLELSEKAQGLSGSRAAHNNFTIDKFSPETAVTKRDVWINVKDKNCKRVEMGHLCQYLERVGYRLYHARPFGGEPIAGAPTVDNYRKRIGVFKWGENGLEIVRGKEGPAVGFLDLVSVQYNVEKSYTRNGVTRTYESPRTGVTTAIGEGRLSN